MLRRSNGALPKERRPVTLDDLARQAQFAAEGLMDCALTAVRERVSENGKLSAARIEAEQHAAHGLAWLATYVEAVKEMAAYAARMREEGRFGQTEELLTRVGLGEYLAQVFGGIPMNQGEIVRLADFGLGPDEIAPFRTEVVEGLIASGNTRENRAALAALIGEAREGAIGDPGLDETFEAIRGEMRRFADAEVAPHAQGWHRANAYIPLEVIAGLIGNGRVRPHHPRGLWRDGARQGRDVRGVGGAVARLYRRRLARHPIRNRRRTHPRRRHRGAEAEIPAQDRERRDPADRRLHRAQHRLRPRDPCAPARCAKATNTWSAAPRPGSPIPVRADLMTLLVRTNPGEKGYRGLSMFLAEKPRGTDADPFPAKGMSGGEIEVLGYRGMKEYEIAFDGFRLPAEALLGGEEGQGFKQLMETFESARIQTAARAVGVAQCAFELGLRYARERVQFGKTIIHFPRVADKLALMAAEIHIARQITYFAGRAKDEGRRCDLEAGMAKLLAARVAWTAADNALQIHGGNGFALEYPISRVLCDARILNIFEGAAEIQAQVIARRLLEGGN